MLSIPIYLGFVRLVCVVKAGWYNEVLIKQNIVAPERAWVNSIRSLDAEQGYKTAEVSRFVPLTV